VRRARQVGELRQEEDTADVVLSFQEEDILRVKPTGELLLNAGGDTGVREGSQPHDLTVTSLQRICVYLSMHQASPARSRARSRERRRR